MAVTAALVLVAIGVATQISRTGAAARELASTSGAVACGTPGALDPSFGTGGKVVTSFGTLRDQANALALQPDGKILTAGVTFHAAGGYDFALARHNIDGSLDSTFGTGGKVITDLPDLSVAYGVAIQPDGRIVAVGRNGGGGFGGSGQPEDFVAVRYNANGSLDGSFGTGGVVVTDFGPSNTLERAYAVIIQPDGKIVAGGTALGPTNRDFALVRYNTDGSLDTGFGTGGKTTTAIGGDDTIYALALQSDGKIVAVGEGFIGFAAARYNPDGSIDTGFGNAGEVTGATTVAKGVAIQADGKIITAGKGQAGGVATNFSLVRLNANGSFDNSLGNSGVIQTDLGPNSEANSMALLPDGRIVAAGMISATGGTDLAVLRYNPNGALDPSFGTGGQVITPLSAGEDLAAAMAIQPDGRIVAAGYQNVGTDNVDMSLVRYTAHACSTSEITVAEGTLSYLGDGQSLGFGTLNVGGTGVTKNFTIRNDGTLPLTLGAFTVVGANPGDFVANITGIATSLAPGQSTTFALTYSPLGPGSRSATLRIETNDPDENPFDLNLTGTAFSGVIYTLSVTSVNGTVTSNPAGINCPGDCSEGFDEGAGASMTLTAAPNVGYRFVGWSGDASGTSNSVTVAVNANKNVTANFARITRFDFDGDGRADLSVRRPSNNTWYFQSASAFWLREFGIAGDQLIPGDYDGDGKIDISVYRSSNRTMYWVASATNTFSAGGTNGTPDDIPLAMDREANRRSRLFFFRPSSGTLHDGSPPVVIGVGYLPVVGDFDGDGKDDAAGYNPTTHAWRIVKTTGGTINTTWGADGDRAVVADYDGDGTSDIAVWRPSTGQWYINASTAGWMLRTWGEPNDIPVPADYDGDGKADIAIFRPSTGTWYIVYSATGNYYVRQFGQDGDVPIPSAYIP